MLAGQLLHAGSGVGVACFLFGSAGAENDGVIRGFFRICHGEPISLKVLFRRKDSAEIRELRAGRGDFRLATKSAFRNNLTSTFTVFDSFFYGRMLK